MVCTELVSHAEISALNAFASRNMLFMCVTELVFHKEMSVLNAVVP